MIDNSQKVDVFIPCSAKDSTQLQYGLKLLVKYVKNVGNIHISMPDKLDSIDVEVDGHRVYYYNDEEILPRTYIKFCGFRPNWIYQQLLKLLQHVTQTPWFFCIDADCLIVKNFDLFSNGKANLFCMPNVMDESAFIRFIARASGGDLATWNENEYAQTTYIADMQMFNRNIIDNMITKYFHSYQEFYQFTVMNTYWTNSPHIRRQSMFISEYEMYGRFCEKYFNDAVQLTPFKKLQIDRNVDSQNSIAYNANDIQSLIDEAVMKNVDVLKLQSNCAASDNQYKQINI